MRELEIPGSWGWARLGDILNIYQPRTISKKEMKDFGKYVVFGANGVIGRYDRYNHAESEVLITCRGATCGTVNMSFPKSWVTGNAMVVSPIISKSIDKRCLFYALQSRDLSSVISGSAQPQITRQKLIPFVIPLPPLGEQDRIVQKIESCFEKADETAKNLEKIEVLIGQYRESLLAKAFRGELVPQAPADEPASVLLEKIRREREKEVKKKKQEFAPIGDDEKPFDIPESWEWVRVGDISHIENGDRGKNYPSKKDLKNKGIPFINAGHLSKGEVDFNKMNFITSDKYHRLSSGKVKEGDIIFCLRGSLGKVALVKGSRQGAIASSLCILRTNKMTTPEYMLKYLSSKIAANEIKKYDNGSAQPNLSSLSLKKFLTPLPLLNEQTRIVQKLEACLAEVEQLRQLVQEKKKALADFKESILANAFCGKLVEQRPEEGTGHDLLAEILAKRERARPKKKKKASAKRKAK